MSNVSIIRPKHLLLGAVVMLFNAGCVDDATGIELAQKHRKNADYSAATNELNNVLQSDPENVQAHRMLGEMALQFGDTQTAIRELRRVQELGATADEYAATMARALLQAGRFQEVVTLDPESVAAPENRAELIALIGSAELKLGDQAAAQRHFQAALELAPGQSDALIGSASIALARGDMSAAESSLTSALKSRPKAPEVLSALAGLQQAKGEYAQAEDSYRKALKATERAGRGKEKMSYLTGLVDVLILQGKTAQAQELGSKMVESTSEHPLALFAAGRADFAAQDFNGAIDKAQRIIATRPSAEPPRMLLASAAMANGDSALATTHLQVVLDANPDNEQAQSLLAQLRMGLDSGDDPEELLFRATELSALAELADVRGDTKAATDLLGQNARLQALAHYNRGLEQAAAGDTEATYASFQAAAESDGTFFPGDDGWQPYARTAIARESIKRGDLETAVSIAESLIADYPQRSEVLLLQAQVRTAGEDFAGALESYEKAAAILPGLEIAKRIYQLQKSMGSPEPWNKLKQWVADNPDDTEAHTLLAVAYQEAGRNELAIENFEQVMAVAPSVRVAVTLAKAEHTAGNLNAAAAWLRKAIALDPYKISARRALVSLELQRGNADAAMTVMRELRTDYPDAAELDTLEGDTLLATGDFKRSMEAYDRALQSESSEQVALKRYQAAKRAGDEDGWRVLQAWFADHPAHVNAGLQLAEDFSYRGRNDAALDVYRRVLNTDPKNLIALNNIALAYIMRGDDGDIELALASASTAYEQNPHNADVADTYGWILHKVGQNEQAVDILATVANAVTRPGIQYHYAVVLASLDRDVEAATVLDRLLADKTVFAEREEAASLRRRLSL